MEFSFRVYDNLQKFRCGVTRCRRYRHSSFPSRLSSGFPTVRRTSAALAARTIASPLCLCRFRPAPSTRVGLVVCRRPRREFAEVAAHVVAFAQVAQVVQVVDNVVAHVVAYVVAFAQVAQVFAYVAGVVEVVAFVVGLRRASILVVCDLGLQSYARVHSGCAESRTPRGRGAEVV